VFEVFLRAALVSIWSAVFVQVKGWQRSFQPSMKVSIAAMRSLQCSSRLALASVICRLTDRDDVQLDSDGSIEA
jgi:hypothetical protein